MSVFCVNVCPWICSYFRQPICLSVRWSVWNTSQHKSLIFCPFCSKKISKFQISTLNFFSVHWQWRYLLANCNCHLTHEFLFWKWLCTTGILGSSQSLGAPLSIEHEIGCSCLEVTTHKNLLIWFCKLFSKEFSNFEISTNISIPVSNDRWWQYLLQLKMVMHHRDFWY